MRSLISIINTLLFIATNNATPLPSIPTFILALPFAVTSSFLPLAMAVDRTKFRTCQQTSFCRRHRHGKSKRLYDYRLVGESVRIHRGGDAIAADDDGVATAAAAGVASGGGGGSLLSKISRKLLLGKHEGVPATGGGGGTRTFGDRLPYSRPNYPTSHHSPPRR